MNHWHGIKPKVLTPKSGKNLLNNTNKINSDKTIEKEVERAVKQLIALNKSENPDSGNVFDDISDEEELGTVDQSIQSGVDHSSREVGNLVTPENRIPAPSLKTEHGKKIRKTVHLKRTNKRPLVETFNELDENHSQGLSPKTSKVEESQRSGKEECTLDGSSSSAINISRYLKVDGIEGRIIKAYFTAGQEEKLKSFTPFYVNIGDKSKAKDLIGIHNNTKFINANSKAKLKPMDELPNYLVLSFENRKKSTSPFIEYPLFKLDIIISALNELKECAINLGLYKEQHVFSSKYPENTKISPKDDKDTKLEMLLQ